MGKAKIVSHLGQAAYKVEILKDVTRVTAAKQRCSDGISQAEADLEQATQDETNASSALAAASAEVDKQIVAANGNASYAPLLSAQDTLNAAAWKLEDAQNSVMQAKLKKLSFETELKTYDGVVGTESTEVWCADATEDLAAGAEVGTIEINQESTQILVAPGGAVTEGQLQPGIANEALTTYLNWAILPGVQKWRPTYRLGTVVEIDYNADTCTVCLDGAHSSAQNIGINIDGAVCESQKDGPQGFLDFCERNPGHAACTTQTDTTLTLTDELKALLQSVNKSVNDGNTYAYDSAQYGKLEYWSEMPLAGGGVGDCEDFALTKFDALVAAGVPAGAIKLATGVVSSGDGHAWLEVQTDQGNIALDLNFTDIQDSESLPYSKRVVQADGLNWASKGLLLFDVPMQYMQCNSGAFEEDDRVVVHFEDRDWTKPKVVGFEEKPNSCGLYAIYKSGGEYKASSLVVTGTEIKAKPDNVILSSKMTGVSGTVPYFYKRAKMKVSVIAGGETTIQERDIAFIGMPFVIDGEHYKYQKDPCQFPQDSYARFFVYAFDIKTRTKVLLFYDFTQIGVCNTPHTESSALGYPNCFMSSWNHSDTYVCFARMSTEVGRSIQCSAQSLKISGDAIGVDRKIDRKISFTNAPYHYGFAVDRFENVVYFDETDGMNIPKVQSTSITTGVATNVKTYDNSGDDYPKEFTMSFYQTCCDNFEGFGVEYTTLKVNYESSEPYEEIKTSDAQNLYEHKGPGYSFLAWGSATTYVAEAASFLTFKGGTPPFFTFFRTYGSLSYHKWLIDVYLSTPHEVKLENSIYFESDDNHQFNEFCKARYNNFGNFFPMTNILANRFSIQHAAYIGYSNGIPMVKDNYIYINEQDKTDQVAAALGCARKDIQGIIYIPGL